MTTLPSAPPSATPKSRRAAVLSAIIPGLGQALMGRSRQAAAIFTMTATLLGCTVVLGLDQGRPAEIFFFMIVVMPWWVIQVYDAWLPKGSEHEGLLDTLKIVWAHGLDIRYLGALFLLSALLDVYIIAMNPSYALPFFCTKPEGALGVLAKGQSPALHTVIGLGFLGLRRWALLAYLVYAAVGLLNAAVNYSCFGYGRIRTVLVVSILIFTAYILWRRQRFDAPAVTPTHPLRESQRQA